jgi:hypothetical protein
LTHYSRRIRSEVFHQPNLSSAAAKYRANWRIFDRLDIFSGGHPNPSQKFPFSNSRIYNVRYTLFQ